MYSNSLYQVIINIQSLHLVSGKCIKKTRNNIFYILWAPFNLFMPSFLLAVATPFFFKCCNFMSLLFVFPQKKQNTLNHVTHCLAPFRYFFFCTKLCSLQVLMCVNGRLFFLYSSHGCKIVISAVLSGVNRALVRPPCIPPVLLNYFQKYMVWTKDARFFAALDWRHLYK